MFFRSFSFYVLWEFGAFSFSVMWAVFTMRKPETMHSPIEWTHKINFECIFPVQCRILFDCFIPSHLKIEIGFQIELKMDWKLLDTCAKIAVFIFFFRSLSLSLYPSQSFTLHHLGLFYSTNMNNNSISTSTNNKQNDVRSKNGLIFFYPFYVLSKHVPIWCVFRYQLRYFCTPTPFCC